MAEVCPFTGEPCALDERIEALMEDIPQEDQAVWDGLTKIINTLRQQGDCTGEFKEKSMRVARHCNHEKITEIGSITYAVGGNMIWPPRSYTGIGVIWENEAKT